MAVCVILYCHTCSVNINESSSSEFHGGPSWIKDQRCFQQPWICFALTMMILSLGATKEAQFLYQKSKESNSQSWLFQSRWPGRPLDVLDATKHHLSRVSGVDHEPQRVKSLTWDVQLAGRPTVNLSVELDSPPVSPIYLGFSHIPVCVLTLPPFLERLGWVFIVFAWNSCS